MHMQCIVGLVNAQLFYLLACPLPLGLSDGRIRDEQLSASSELDDTHAAKQGRVSLISPSKNRYRAADREARFKVPLTPKLFSLKILLVSLISSAKKSSRLIK